jgi:hypothetical protein
MILTEDKNGREWLNSSEVEYRISSWYDKYTADQAERSDGEFRDSEQLQPNVLSRLQRTR